ncbi:MULTISPECIES: hypothetical protein [Enterobacteriaceae]|uniref:Uncharacterized protein n=1 Tax=Lelliottia amnigena TaxID=61646 RepID=A0ABU7UJI6_LELAM|nr:MULTISPECIES: hypothetical protein [Enterobacteriaceae]OXL37653.1 hypothetical protein CA284_19940 [Enterobacter mori]CAH8250080.1 Uncharacterised protein [Enterobacter ludwigii]CAH8250164.1 Uncharacterised protein [Escherichia coli]
MGMFDTVMFRYRLPDGVTGTEFQTKDLDCQCDSYEISAEGRLLRWMEDNTRNDTCFDEMLTLSADDGYHLYFENGTVKWIEIYSQGNTRFPFDPAKALPVLDLRYLQ